MKQRLPLFTKRTCVILLLTIGLGFTARATHIVGGEMELTHISGYNYRLGLIIYFDDVNGQPGARDEFVDISVFSKSENALINNFLLPLRTDEFVNYTDPDCAVGDLRTRRIYYSLEVFLSPGVFNEREGYYFVHERCCRNGTINNIEAPGDAAQAFYMEMPPVIIDETPFVNNSPRLFPPLSDYGCVGQPFFFDFSGSDADGDSLAYSLAEPLNGFSTADNPKPPVMNPGPYPTVTFVETYSVDTMVKGTPPLSIDAEGFLTVTPSEVGLFVFSIKCEEYRDGVKIGEVVRDFQMMVLDCPEFTPPVISASSVDGQTYISGDTIVYEIGEDSPPCIDISVTDADPNTFLQSRIRQLSGAPDNLTILGDLNAVINPGETAFLSVCIDECPEAFNEIYSAMILVGDNSCSLPLFDTLSFVIDVRYPNMPPTLESDDLVFRPDSNFYEVTIELGDTLTFDMIGLDADGDSITISPIGNGFDMLNERMFFSTSAGRPPISSSFFWQPSCDNFGAFVPEKSWLIDYIISDYGDCGLISTDTVQVKVNLKNIDEPNSPPEMTPGDLVGINGTYRDTIYLGNDYTLDISALDLEGDSLRLFAEALGFDLSEVGISFIDSATGSGSITSTLFWQPDCGDLGQPAAGDTAQLYTLELIATDYNDCFRQDADTVRLELLLVFEPDPANAPQITIPGAAFNPNDRSYFIRVEAGSNLELGIFVTDDVGDTINLDVEALGFDLQDLLMNFTPQQGVGDVSGQFTWSSDCSMLKDTLSQNRYDLLFTSVNPQACGIEAVDSVRLTIELIDIPRPPVENFPNAFSPNGDGIGDEFYITMLPPDTCEDRFEGIEITNRWGDVVFTSNDRLFRWDGDDLPSGVYYYFIDFSISQYKGTINLVRSGD